MNVALIVGLFRQRLLSPIRMVFLLFAFTMPLLFVAAAPGMGLAAVQNATTFALIFGAGLVGQDVSSGVLQLLLARPLRRSEYALSRWIGAAGMAALAAVLHDTMAAAILTFRGAAPNGGELAAVVTTHVTGVFGIVAVLLALSCLVPGLGDLGLYVLGTIVAQLMNAIGGAARIDWLQRSGAEIGRFLAPDLPVRVAATTPVAWQDLVTYLSTVTLCLAIGIVALNRKELSYAQN